MDDEQGSWNQYQKLVLALLEKHEEKLEILQRGLTESNVERQVTLDKISILKEDTVLLLKLVKDGLPAAPSVLARLDHLEAYMAGEKETLKIRNADKKTNKAAIISVLIAGATIIWNIVERFLLGK